ncbi:MAG: SAM-dependent methyltransferase [Bacteroidales bacterium]|nr:SAM-dependent methyltransferase [Bacteroidales bacterium]
MNGRLYLIPTPLGDYPPQRVLTPEVLAILPTVEVFFVEELRTARRFLSAAGLKGHIEALELHEINEHTSPEQISALAALLKGRTAALISEAGLPAVADPGAQLVALAHEKGIEVLPQVGPSSLMMALMSSGMNGQCFAFTGYLPVKPDARRARIAELERRSAREGQSQIVIETPYRNDALLADLLAVCRPETRLCVAADITLPTQMILSKTVAAWRKAVPVIGKRPCVFVIQG